MTPSLHKSCHSVIQHWLRSFLTGRSQQALHDGRLSNMLVLFGVSRGSVVTRQIIASTTVTVVMPVQMICSFTSVTSVFLRPWIMPDFFSLLLGLWVGDLDWRIRHGKSEMVSRSWTNWEHGHEYWITMGGDGRWCRRRQKAARKRSRRQIQDTFCDPTAWLHIREVFKSNCIYSKETG